MKIGITGTQDGATSSQLVHLRTLLVTMGTTELHHGDCIGADAQAHTVAEELQIRTVLHPPTNDSKRAFCLADEDCPPRPYLERNHDIVDAVDHVIAMPKEADEQIRSGTWATVRYARRMGKPCTVLAP